MLFWSGRSLAVGPGAAGGTASPGHGFPVSESFAAREYEVEAQAAIVMESVTRTVQVFADRNGYRSPFFSHKIYHY